MVKKLTLLNVFTYTIIAYWAIWFTIVSSSDFINLLQALNIVPDTVKFSSHNFELLTHSLNLYITHTHLLALILYEIIVASAIIIGVLFWMGLFNLTIFKLPAAYLALLLSLLFSFSFMFFHEITLQYGLAHSLHQRILFHLISMAIYLSNLFFTDNNRK